MIVNLKKSSFTYFTEFIVGWDIGGGSMQFSYKILNDIEVLGSTDSSTLFSNRVIKKIKNKDPIPSNSPNPLSNGQKEKCIELSSKRAEKLFSKNTKLFNIWFGTITQKC